MASNVFFTAWQQDQEVKNSWPYAKVNNINPIIENNLFDTERTVYLYKHNSTVFSMPM